MKLFLAALLLSSAFAREVNDEPQLRARFLEGGGDKGDFFIENNATFNCVTLLNNKLVRFGPCQFSTKPSVQMWRFQDDGKVRSLANPTKCWWARKPSDTIVLVDCDASPGKLRKFSLGGDGEGGTGQIKVGDGRCLRDTWDDADPAKTSLIADTCNDSDSFHWQRYPIRYFTIYGIDGGCIVPAYGENGITFASCDYPSDANIITHWFQDDNGNVHSRLDPDKCLQAAHGNVINDGTKMRFYPCDKNKANQKFEHVTTGTIKLKSRGELCLVAQGDPPTKDVSEVILKSCGSVRHERAFGWTAASASGD